MLNIQPSQQTLTCLNSTIETQLPQKAPSYVDSDAFLKSFLKMQHGTKVLTF